MLGLWFLSTAFAQDLDPSNAIVSSLATGINDTPVSTAVRLLLTLSAMSFLPAMLVVMTPFVRFVVVFSVIRQALGLSQTPPNQVIVGLSMFLSLLVMEPTLSTAYTDGFEPFLAGTMQPLDALHHTLEPIRGFMLANTRKADMQTMLQVANMARPESLNQISTALVTSAFVLSELKTSLVITVYIFIPFLVIDIVVGSILLGMGMMMLPPATVSMPLKILIFVLSDGWALLIRDMVQGINR
jgi:flagellar biosynthetic protein FliP